MIILPPKHVKIRSDLKIPAKPADQSGQFIFVVATYF